MTTQTKTKQKEITNDIKYCSCYDEDCHIIDPFECFIGGEWECQNGHKSIVPIADGVCKMMEINRRKIK